MAEIKGPRGRDQSLYTLVIHMCRATETGRTRGRESERERGAKEGMLALRALLSWCACELSGLRGADCYCSAGVV